MKPVITEYLAALGRKGGKARAESLSPERRLEIAQKASEAARKARRERAMEDCPRCAVRGCMGDCAVILREAKRKAAK